MNELKNATDFIGKIVTVTIDRPLNSTHHKFGWKYKLIVVPDEVELTDEEIILATHFQEQFFKSVVIREVML